MILLIERDSKDKLYDLLVLEINKINYKKNYSIRNGISFLGLIALKAFKKFKENRFLNLSQLITNFLKSKILIFENHFFIFDKNTDDIVFGLENGIIGIIIYLINYSSVSKDSSVDLIIEQFFKFIIKNLDKNNFGLHIRIKEEVFYIHIYLMVHLVWHML